VTYLPWLFLGIDIISGADILPSLISLSIGYSYYFLKFVFPINYNI